jgi:hypothetical protein
MRKFLMKKSNFSNKQIYELSPFSKNNSKTSSVVLSFDNIRNNNSYPYYNNKNNNSLQNNSNYNNHFENDFFSNNYHQYQNAVNNKNNEYLEQKSNKPTILLLKRSSVSKHTRNRFDSVRQWSDSFANSIFIALKNTFPQFNIILLSDKNDTLMTCYSCQIKLFHTVDVLIGVHGAGLGNMLYMKPNSAVVELGPYGNDGRCLLGGGPFSRLAAVLSHNYMIHHPLYEEFKWIKTDLTSEFNVARFIIHISSFLYSINFIREL